MVMNVSNWERCRLDVCADFACIKNGCFRNNACMCYQN